MSEFSESYHLRSERPEDAGELLRSLGLKGFVYPAESGWVTFLAEGGDFTPNLKIAAAAQQPLLHYISAEDHGWAFALFEQGKLTCGYQCEWNDDVAFDVRHYSRAALQRCIPALTEEALVAFESLLQPEGIDDAMEAAAANTFAQTVGLPRYEWLSYDYVVRDRADSPDEFAAVTKIN